MNDNINMSRDISKEDFKKLLIEAENGDSAAQLAVGKGYRLGWGTRKNLHKAYVWITKAITNGNIEALCSLGNMYAVGDFVDQNYEYAIELYQKSFNQGYAPAASLIANLYMHMADQLSCQISDLAFKMLEYKQNSMLWYLKGKESNDTDSIDMLKEYWDDYQSRWKEIQKSFVPDWIDD